MDPPSTPCWGCGFHRGGTWEPQVSQTWGNFPPCHEMETPSFSKLGRLSVVWRNGSGFVCAATWKEKKPGVPRGLDPQFRNTTSSLDSGDGFHRHGNPKFPVRRKNMETRGFRRGAGHGNPKFPGLGRGPPPCAAKWKPQFP